MLTLTGQARAQILSTNFREVNQVKQECFPNILKVCRSIYENRHSKVKLKKISKILIRKLILKMNSIMIKKICAADPEIRFPTESILQPFGLTSPFR